MRSLKRSRTSKKINEDNFEKKKIKSKNQDLEEKILKLVINIKKEQNLFHPKLKGKNDITLFFKKSKSKNMLEIKKMLNDSEMINYILTKTKKSENDILILKLFLCLMNFLSSLKGNFNIDKLLNSLSSHLKLEKKNKNTLIFRQGNKGNKFYIILEGEVSVLIPKEMENKVEISFKRYFLHLMLLKILKEDELIKKIITANAKIKYHFDDRDFDIYFERIVDFVDKYMSDIINPKKNNEDEKDKIIREIKENNQNLFIKKNSVVGYNNFYFNQKNKNGIIDFKNSLNEMNNNNILNSKVKTGKNLDLQNTLSSKLSQLKKEEGEKEEAKEEEEEKEKEEKENEDEEKEKEEDEVKKEIKKIDKLYNYSDIDIPFFDLNDIKDILFYYIFLKQKIDSKPKIITVSEYIRNTYIDSPFHVQLKSDKFDKKEEYVLLKYIEIKRKKAGESFGELALQREDNKRTGTIITLTDCHLGVLSRNDYTAYLRDLDAKKRKLDVNFMMSFSIFNKMNLTVFESRFFNFFTKENFFQGKNIIIQDKKVDKVFFIAEGQFEIMTNLSLLKIYSLLNHKIKREVDNEKIKKKFPKDEYNLRLYISQNRDILGLDDCCYGNDTSFITAKCLSDDGQAFTIDKSILNEIRVKLPEIDKKISRIILEREKMMIDRLINIYNRIILSRNNNRKEHFKENNKAQEPFKYINYFFGIKQGDRNSNAKKISTRISNHKRVQSAIFQSQEKKIFRLINDGDFLNNDLFLDDNNSRFSIFKSNIDKSKMSSKIKIIDALRFYNSVKNQNNSPKDKSKFMDSSEKKINLDKSLRLIGEIMDSSIKSNEKILSLKSERSNKNSKEKDLVPNISLNKMKMDEYNRFFNWLENSKDFKKTTLSSEKGNNKIIKLKTMDKINTSKRFFSAFNFNRRKKITKLRPFSNINESRIPIQGELSSISKNVSNYNSEYEKEIKTSKVSNYKFTNFRNNKKKLSRAITPDLAYPIKLKGKLNAEKFLKRMLGTRYKDQFISYEEQKFNKLIESFDIQKEFLNKSKLKFALKREKNKVFIKGNREYKAYDSKLKDINFMLKF